MIEALLSKNHDLSESNCYLFKEGHSCTYVPAPRLPIAAFAGAVPVIGSGLARSALGGATIGPAVPGNAGAGRVETLAAVAALLLSGVFIPAIDLRRNRARS